MLAILCYLFLLHLGVLRLKGRRGNAHICCALVLVLIVATQGSSPPTPPFLEHAWVLLWNYFRGQSHFVGNDSRKFARWLSFKKQKSLLASLRVQVSLLIIDLVNAALLEVCAIDCLSIVVRDISGLAGLRDGVVFIVDESYELCPLLVCNLDVLTNHSCVYLKLLLKSWHTKRQS